MICRSIITTIPNELSSRGVYHEKALPYRFAYYTQEVYQQNKFPKLIFVLLSILDDVPAILPFFAEAHIKWLVFRQFAF